MWAALLAAVINLLTKIIDITSSDQFRTTLKERKNEQRENEARKAIVKKDAVLVAAITADQHDRVLALCGGAGKRENTDQRSAVGPDASR